MSIREDVINLRVQINGEMAGKSMKDLRGEIKAAKAETDNLKVGTDEYNKAAAKLALIEGKYKAIQKETRDAANEVAGLGKATSGFGDVFKGALAAISFDRIISGAISFGKESMEAFLQADREAQKLKFAVQGINGETGGGLKELNKQADELMNKGFFDDDDITKAQAMQATFGLTSQQILKLTPQIVDFAKATGDDLATATDKVIKGINGQVRGLKDVGIVYEDTGSKTQNLAILTEKLAKFQGAAAASMETASGKADAEKVKLEELKEAVGERLVPVYQKFQEVLWGGIRGLQRLTEEMDPAAQAAKRNSDQIAAFVTNYGHLTDKELEMQRAFAQSNLTKILKERTQAFADNDFARANSLNAEILSLANELKVIAQLQKKGKEEEQKVKDDATAKGLAEQDKANQESLKRQEEYTRNTNKLRDQISENNAASIMDDEQREIASLVARSQKQASEIRKMIASEEVKSDALIALSYKTARESADIEKKYNDKRIKNSETAQKELTDILNQATEADRQAVELQAQKYAAAAAGRVRATKDGTQQRLDAEKELALAEEQLALAKLDPMKNNEEQKIQIHREFLDKIAALDGAASEEKKKQEQKTKQEIEDLARDAENKIYNIIQARERKETDMKLKNLQKQLSNKSITQEQYDKEERTIKRVAAEDEKERAVFQVTLEGIIMVAKALAAAGGVLFAPNVIMAGIAAGIQIAAVAATPIPEFAQGGPTFAGGGHVANPSIGLIGEAGPEWVAPNWMLTDPHYANTFSALENVRQRGFAAGGPTVPENISGKDDSAALNQMVASVLNEVRQELAALRVNGVKGYWDWQRYNDGVNQMKQIESDSRL